MPSPQLDQMDILAGSEYHQEGPYEALSPRRNKNRNRANSDAPVAAFSPNGPNSNPAITNKQEEREFKMEPHLEVTHELHDDEPVPGPTSAGLGSTTFMENTPASEAAIREQAAQDKLKPVPFGHSNEEEGFLERVRSFGRGNDEKEGLLDRVRSVRSRKNTLEAEQAEPDLPAQGQSSTVFNNETPLVHRK